MAKAGDNGSALQSFSGSAIKAGRIMPLSASRQGTSKASICPLSRICFRNFFKASAGPFSPVLISAAIGIAFSCICNLLLMHFI
jgi:hypothetical protein